MVCPYCSKDFHKFGYAKHVSKCYLNPKNKRLCAQCRKPIKNIKWSNVTCSHSCSNKYFRSGEMNGNWKGGRDYKRQVKKYHKMECVVCGENRVVDIHHIDGDRNNNLPNNLVPLCPTHHRYMHSKFSYLIEDIVKNQIVGQLG